MELTAGGRFRVGMRLKVGIKWGWGGYKAGLWVVQRAMACFLVSRSCAQLSGFSCICVLFRCFGRLDLRAD